MHWGNWILVVRLVIIAAALAVGCGAPKTTAPKTEGELTEKEKQQIRELNEQRAQEWGTKKP